MHAAPTQMPERLKSDTVAGHWSLVPVAAIATLLTYYALHRGSYSLTDRQQMAVLVWVAVAAAAIAGLLPRARPAGILWLPFAALTAMAVWTAIGLTYTESAERTFNELARIVGYLGVVTLVWLAVTRHDWRRLAAALPAAAVLVCGLAVLSRFWPSVFPADDVAARFGTYRLSYPFGYWNAMGCWAAMSITLCLAWAAHARSAAVRAVALAAVPVCALALYFTVSRAALGGAVLGPAVVIALGSNRWLAFLQSLVAGVGAGVVVAVARGQTELVQAISSKGTGTVLPVLAIVSVLCGAVAVVFHRVDAGERLRMHPRAARRALVVGAVLAAMVAVVVLPSATERAWDQFNQTTPTFMAGAGPDARLTNLSGHRMVQWKSAWRAFESNRTLGIGPGSFEYWWNRDGVNSDHIRDVHNIYLEALAEGGVPGFLLLIGFLSGMLVASTRARSRIATPVDRGIHSGLIGVFAVFMLQSGVDWIWESTAVTVLVLTAIAIAGAAASELLRAPGERGGTTASASVALVLVALIAVVIQLPGLSSESNLKASRNAAASGDFKIAAVEASDAISAMPWAASSYAQRGLALENLGKRKSAVADYEKASSLEPTNWQWRLLLAGGLAKLGEGDRAANSFQEAKRLRPHSLVFQGE